MSASFIAAIFIFGGLVASSAYILATRIRLMAVVDLTWTVGLGAVSVALLTQLQSVSARALLVLAVILIWSFRISRHLLRDRVLPRVEDGRYQDLREHWGSAAGASSTFCSSRSAAACRRGCAICVRFTASGKRRCW